MFSFVVIATGFSCALSWGVGRVVTDRWAALQYLYWIPTPIAIVVSVVCALALQKSRWSSCRKALWGFALVQMTIFGIQDIGIWRGETPRASTSATSIRIAHINANWPGEKSREIAVGLAAALKAHAAQAHAAQAHAANGGPEVIFISEFGGMLSAESAAQYCPQDSTTVSVGRFGVVSRIPIIELTLLYDASKMTAALVRFAAWKGNGPWGCLLVDVPSDPALSRVALLATLRGHLNATLAQQPDLVVGDFNTTRGSASVEAFAPSMRDAFVIAGRGYGATFPRFLPFWHIDLMLHGSRVSAVRYELIDPGAGKHLLQFAEVFVEAAAQ